MQQNLENSMQNLQAEVQQIAKDQVKLQHDTHLDLLNLLTSAYSRDEYFYIKNGLYLF